MNTSRWILFGILILLLLYCMYFIQEILDIENTFQWEPMRLYDQIPPHKFFVKPAVKEIPIPIENISTPKNIRWARERLMRKVEAMA